VAGSEQPAPARSRRLARWHRRGPAEAASSIRSSGEGYGASTGEYDEKQRIGELTVPPRATPHTRDFAGMQMVCSLYFPRLRSC
jgi:hypothetical protein